MPTAVRRPVEPVVITRVDVGDPFEILTAKYVTQQFAPHMHDGFAFGVIEEGASLLGVGGRKVMVPEGAIVAINPGVVHTGGPAGPSGWSYRMFYPSAAFMAHVSAAITDGSEKVPDFTDPVFLDPPLAASLCAIHRRLEWAGSTLAADELVLEAFAAVVTRCSRQRPATAVPRASRAVIRRATDYLEANWQRCVRIQEVATECGLSEFHFIRLFRREVGLPPYRYLENVRARHARAMLRDGRPLADIVAAAGYSDQSHFTRHFKRVFGVTPGSYARSWLRGPVESASLPPVELLTNDGAPI